jgi:hypothetical protein
MRLSKRDGFALPIAIGSMVVIGMLIAGVFFAATQENRVGRATLIQERAFRAAEFGLNHVYGTWKNTVNNSLAQGDYREVTYDSLADKGWKATVRVTKLNDNTYLLVSTAVAARQIGDTARHRTGAIVRVGYPTINFLAALTVRGSITIGGNSYTNGTDTPPTGWDCPTPGAMQPGVATSNRGNISTVGCTRLRCIDGDPDVKVTSAANDTSTYFNYGPDANWATLTAAYSVTFANDQTLNNIGPTLTAGGECNTNDNLNWGDPGRADPEGPCEGYFPIVYFSNPASTVHLTTGKGQGILLVDGDLVVDGGFEWFGPVIVRGHLTTAGTGGHFNGAVMAADVNLELNSVLGNALITYSSCANSSALVGAGIANRIQQRARTDMF